MAFGITGQFLQQFSKSFPEISHVRSEKIGISKYVSEQKLFTEINREREFSKSEGTHVKS